MAIQVNPNPLPGTKTDPVGAKAAIREGRWIARDGKVAVYHWWTHVLIGRSDREGVLGATLGALAEGLKQDAAIESQIPAIRRLLAAMAVLPR